MPMSNGFDATILLVTAVIALRLAVLAALLPVISAKSVPVLWRLALAVVIATAIAPTVTKELVEIPTHFSWELLTIEALRSIVIGALLAFVVGIPFAAVRFAGQIIGVQIGFSLANTIDPQSGGQASVLSNFYYLLAVMFFFASDAHHILITAMTESVRLVPPFSAVFGVGGSWYLLTEFGSFFVIGLKIAAPVIIVLLLVSITMGFIVKTVPQINILVVGFPVKIATGLAVLGLSMFFFGSVFENILINMGLQFEEILAILGS
jgi:flagellar biosynthesis protein FliR